ncbi:GNAT family N-acetyltransferase, partial [Sphaerisporangium sp. NPDC088356]|uniref:GNAT family N-acetyltransferase n=1 Tax=Sphaerisporangium sp. NPDC088356 TaxID=3154871 RepID=UPI0034445988
ISGRTPSCHIELTPRRGRGPGAAQIFSFFGHPDGWGSGIGSTLMTATLGRLRQNGFREVHLWTLRDTPQSRRFYAKNGFTESGAVRGFDFGDGNPIAQVEYELVLASAVATQ